MEPRTDTTKGNGKGTRGRKGKDKQEAVVEIGKLREKLPHLVQLKNTADGAASDLNDAIKATAEKCGLLASVVRKVVVASAGENFEEKKREAEQLSLAFEEVEK